MSANHTNTPLWKELKNAANLEGLHIGEFLELVSKKSLNIAITDNAAEGADLASCINSYKEMASFKYADLAKNNLHKLAEVLESVVDILEHGSPEYIKVCAVLKGIS